MHTTVRCCCRYLTDIFTQIFKDLTLMAAKVASTKYHVLTITCQYMVHVYFRGYILLGKCHTLLTYYCVLCVEF